MNELLQKHGCANVFSVPEGLKELMGDISREVLREQPPNMYEFISNYLSVLLITREHGVLALRILDDLCDCKPSISEHLLQIGMEKGQAESLAQVIKEEVEDFDPVEGKEKLREMRIMKKILRRQVLDEEMAAKVCQVARNAYRDYWYRKKLLEESMKVPPDEPWEIAAQHTLELYKRTKPSFTELTRATQKIQAAYRGYHVRKNLLNHLKPKKEQRPKFDFPGAPLDIAASREIDLGPIIDIDVHQDNVSKMLDEYAGEQLDLRYDPIKTTTYLEDEVLEPASSRLNQEVAQGLDLTTPVAGGKPSVPSATIVEGAITLGGRQASTGISNTVEAKSRASRQYNEESGPRLSRLTSQMEGVPRSRQISQIQDHFRKISFVESPPEIIPNVDYDDIADELHEDEGGKSSAFAIMKPDEDQEVHEEPGIEPAATVELDSALEVPEDIADDRSEGDEESIPTASEPTSEPVTADNTDVEDAGETTEEEEGN